MDGAGGEGEQFLTSSGIDDGNAREGCNVIKLFKSGSSISNSLNLHSMRTTKGDVTTVHNADSVQET